MHFFKFNLKLLAQPEDLFICLSELKFVILDRFSWLLNSFVFTLKFINFLQKFAILILILLKSALKKHHFLTQCIILNFILTISLFWDFVFVGNLFDNQIKSVDFLAEDYKPILILGNFAFTFGGISNHLLFEHFVFWLPTFDLPCFIFIQLFDSFVFKVKSLNFRFILAFDRIYFKLGGHAGILALFHFFIILRVNALL